LKLIGAAMVYYGSGTGCRQSLAFAFLDFLRDHAFIVGINYGLIAGRYRGFCLAGSRQFIRP
jgi:hypothetical protein